jgi:hypothetical protein
LDKTVNGEINENPEKGEQNGSDKKDKNDKVEKIADKKEKSDKSEKVEKIENGTVNGVNGDLVSEDGDGVEIEDELKDEEREKLMKVLVGELENLPPLGSKIVRIFTQFDVHR